MRAMWVKIGGGWYNLNLVVMVTYGVLNGQDGVCIYLQGVKEPYWEDETVEGFELLLQDLLEES